MIKDYFEYEYKFMDDHGIIPKSKIKLQCCLFALVLGVELIIISNKTTQLPKI